MVTFAVSCILIALFALALLFPKRFGLLGLALAAGTLLADQTFVWLEDFFMLFKQYLGGIEPTQAVAILLTLLPSLIILFSGQKKYHTKKGRIVGAILYTVMAGFAFLPFVIGSMDVSNEVRDVIMTSHTTTIIIGIVVAIVDLVVPHINPDKK